MIFETLNVNREGAVLFAEIAAPPMNLLGPELVRDLVSLIQQAEADDAIRVLVFRSADPDYFISHVDVTRIKEYRQEAAKLTGEPSIALLFRHLSASRLVTIAQIEGRVRAGGSEFVLACDMRFAARESAIFSQPEPALGVLPGGGASQHLARLMGRASAQPNRQERPAYRQTGGRPFVIDGELYRLGQDLPVVRIRCALSRLRRSAGDERGKDDRHLGEQRAKVTRTP